MSNYHKIIENDLVNIHSTNMFGLRSGYQGLTDEQKETSWCLFRGDNINQIIT